MAVDSGARLGRRSRRAIGVVVASLLTVTAVGYYQRAEPSRVVLGRGEAPAPASPSPAADPASKQVDSPIDGFVPTTGPGLTRSGVTLVVQPTGDDALRVSETVRLDSPASRIQLRTPRVRRAGGQFAGAVPRATGLRLIVAGRAVPLPAEIGRERVEVDLGDQVTAYQLSYVLTGTTVRSVPSTAGRALVAVGPLTSARAGRVMIYAGSRVLNLSCPLLSGNAVSCSGGATTPRQLSRPLSGRKAVALLQIDLPGR